MPAASRGTSCCAKPLGMTNSIGHQCGPGAHGSQPVPGCQRHCCPPLFAAVVHARGQAYLSSEGCTCAWLRNRAAQSSRCLGTYSLTLPIPTCRSKNSCTPCVRSLPPPRSAVQRPRAWQTAGAPALGILRCVLEASSHRASRAVAFYKTWRLCASVTEMHGGSSMPEGASTSLGWHSNAGPCPRIPAQSGLPCLPHLCWPLPSQVSPRVHSSAQGHACLLLLHAQDGNAWSLMACNQSCTRADICQTARSTE